MLIFEDRKGRRLAFNVEINVAEQNLMLASSFLHFLGGTYLTNFS